MGAIVQMIIGFLSGGAGEKIGQGVANAGALAALFAALTPVVIWITGHKDDVFIVLTYGDLTFWLGLGGAFWFAVIKVAQYTRPPRGDA